MSKFTLTKCNDGNYSLRYDGVVGPTLMHFDASDLPALYSCVGAAMAESRPSLGAALDSLNGIGHQPQEPASQRNEQ